MPTYSRTGAFLPARYYALLVQMIQSADLSTSDLLEPIGLDLETLEDPETMLSPAQVDALIAGATSMTGREDLAMQLGRMIKPSSHEYLGYALMTSATLDDAMRLAARYWRLITPAFQLSLDRIPGAIRITLTPVVEMSLTGLRFHVETIATAFHEEIRFLLSGQIPVYDVHLLQARKFIPESGVGSLRRGCTSMRTGTGFRSSFQSASPRVPWPWPTSRH